MSVVMRNSSQTKHVAVPNGIKLRIRETSVDAALLLIAQAPLGTNVAVICNTVNNAKRLFGAIMDAPNVSARLLHSRMFGEHRMSKDREVLRDFGKNAERNYSSINVVVSTQVIEQSLDLDFDVMFTELSPIENVFQRAGRLHRHSHKNANRPADFKEPSLWLMRYQNGSDALLSDRGVSYIYHDYLTQRLRHYLGTISPTEDIDCEIQIPAALKSTLEAVYDPETLPEFLEDVADDYERVVDEAAEDATHFLTPAPVASRTAPVIGWNDRPQSIEDFSGMKVRQGDSGPSVALLLEVDGGLAVPYIEGSGKDEKWGFHFLDTDGKVSQREELRVIGATITLQFHTVSDKDVLNQMAEEAPDVYKFWRAPTPDFHALKSQLAIVLRTDSQNITPDNFLDFDWTSEMMGSKTLMYNAEGATI